MPETAFRKFFDM